VIGIIDYGLGNLRSVQNMLHRIGFDSIVSSDPAEIRAAEKLILPGVGHFRFGMESLERRGLVNVLNERVIEAHVPILGICLGAQILGRHSEEGGVPGLGYVPMDIVAFDKSQLTHGERVPHMGWATTSHEDCPLFSGLDEAARFYYVHSFHFVCDDPAMVICSAEHGYRFASGVAVGNIFGVQFHPEKSHAYGMQLLKNFAEMGSAT
jgi:glutamine amidotransferase